MDRRRFLPSPEGLEGRALQSILQPPSVQAIKAQLNQTTTVTGKLIRIQQLPNFFRSVVPGRVVSPALVSRIQADLEPLIGTLHAASTPAKNELEHTLRETLSHASLTKAEADALDRSFGHFLESAGATAQQQTFLRLDLIRLASRDAAEPKPVMLATNDYAIAAQVAISVGRPIKTPTAPRLAVADSLEGKGGHKTTVAQPHLVGSYDPSATMQALDPLGNVLGQAEANTGGNYSVKIAQPLAPGTYVFRVRAIEDGFISPVSAPVTVTILPKPVRHEAAVPAGPKALGG
jgi:hypothetical protein